MLMLNHSDKLDGGRIPRFPMLQPTVDGLPPRTIEISSTPGSPFKVTDLIATGKYLSPSYFSPLLLGRFAYYSIPQRCQCKIPFCFRLRFSGFCMGVVIFFPSFDFNWFFNWFSITIAWGRYFQHLFSLLSNFSFFSFIK